MNRDYKVSYPPQKLINETQFNQYQIPEKTI